MTDPEVYRLRRKVERLENDLAVAHALIRDFARREQHQDMLTAGRVKLAVNANQAELDRCLELMRPSSDSVAAMLAVLEDRPDDLDLIVSAYPVDVQPELRAVAYRTSAGFESDEGIATLRRYLQRLAGITEADDAG